MSPAARRIDPEGEAVTRGSAADRPEPWASPSFARRCVAFLLDGAIALLLSTVEPAGALFAVAYLVLRDGLWRGGSIGKRLLALRVVRSDGSTIGLRESLRRNAMFAVPLLNAAISVAVFEGVLLYFDEEGLRLGDRIAGTRVVPAGRRRAPAPDLRRSA